MTSRILVLDSVLEKIELEIQPYRNSNTETGGILIGAPLDAATVLILGATGPGPRAEHHGAEYALDHEYGQYELDRVVREFPAADYVGEWHRHPGRMDYPSSGDYQTAARILHDPAYKLTELINPIVILPDGQFIIRFYRLGIEDVQQRRNFSPIEPVVVSRDDPAVAGFLAQQRQVRQAQPRSRPGRPPQTTAPAPNRLQSELTALGQRYRIVNQVQDADGTVLEVAPRHAPNVTLFFVCPPGYPSTPPDVVLTEDGQERAVRSEHLDRWTANTRLVDIADELTAPAPAPSRTPAPAPPAPPRDSRERPTPSPLPSRDGSRALVAIGGLIAIGLGAVIAAIAFLGGDGNDDAEAAALAATSAAVSQLTAEASAAAGANPPSATSEPPTPTATIPPPTATSTPVVLLGPDTSCADANQKAATELGKELPPPDQLADDVAIVVSVLDEAQAAGCRDLSGEGRNGDSVIFVLSPFSEPATNDDQLDLSVRGHQLAIMAGFAKGNTVGKTYAGSATTFTDEREMVTVEIVGCRPEATTCRAEVRLGDESDIIVIRLTGAADEDGPTITPSPTPSPSAATSTATPKPPPTETPTP